MGEGDLTSTESSSNEDNEFLQYINRKILPLYSNTNSNTLDEIQSLTEPTSEELLALIQGLLKEIAEARGNPLLYLFCPEEHYLESPDSVGIYAAFRDFNDEIEDLDILIHSRGGDIHEAYDICKLCQNYTKGNVTAFVPLRAMSASGLIALGADKVVISEVGKLGPLDPQIDHPELSARTPLRAVSDIPEVLSEALASGNNSVDPELRGEHVVKPIAKQVDPYFLTQYKEGDELAKEYGTRVLTRRGVSEKKAKRCLEYLVNPPSSHLYRVDLQEIQSTQRLSDVINARGMSELKNGLEIERIFMRTAELFLAWEISKDKWSDAKIDLIKPTGPGDQQELTEVSEEDD